MYRIKSIEGNEEMFYFNLFQKSELTFFRTQFFQSHILKIFIMIILLSFNLNFMHAFIKMVKKLLIYQIKIREDVECFFFFMQHLQCYVTHCTLGPLPLDIPLVLKVPENWEHKAYPRTMCGIMHFFTPKVIVL